MRQTGELAVQEVVTGKLVSLDIFPFSVIFTYNSGIDKELLCITFFDNFGVTRFLDYLGYEKSCDKSGYTIIEDKNVVILSGMALFNFYYTL